MNAASENGLIKNKSAIYVSFAENLTEIREAQVLRYQVFSEEMGACLKTTIPYHDVDEYDAYCHHLLVRDKHNHNKIIGYTRILTSEQAPQAGGFYSESEFDLSQILQLQGRFMEIGRTCVHPDYRNGYVMNVLWSGLAQFMVMNQLDYMMGCASVPLADNCYNPLFQELRTRYYSPSHLRVIPHCQLRADPQNLSPVSPMPSLLKAYLRLGAQICGEPCWDNDFKVADVFILLSMDNLQQRYMRHFVNRANRHKSALIHEVAA